MSTQPLRHVVLVLLGCFFLLFVQLNRIQVIDAEELRQHPANTRTVQRDFNRDRGPIVTADGTVVARSEDSEGAFERLRIYPEGDLYAHSAGFLSFNLGAAGIERIYNDDLVGRRPELQFGGLADILREGEPTGEVVMTLRHDLQTVARDALGPTDGSVVALDPRTGQILALWSYPSYDPNTLASHNGRSVNESYTELTAASGNPLRAASYRDIFFPGSTFKVVTAAAGLSTGVATLTSPVFVPAAEYTPPLTDRPLTNFGGSTCGGDILEMLRVSCNTGFAELGAGLLGPQRLIDQAQSFGFNTVPPIDLPGAEASRFPTDFGNELRPPSFELPAGVFEESPALAQTSIGQNDVAATPLQMAMVAAAVANDGVIMEPRVVSEIRNLKGDRVRSVGTNVWLRPFSPVVATDLRTALVNVVENGTARQVQMEGVEVGAKTGTAQLGIDPPQSHAWMIAFAGPPGEPSEIAVAVLVEANPGAADQTGGRVAGPIVAAILDQYFLG